MPRIGKITFNFTTRPFRHAIMRRPRRSVPRQITHTGDDCAVGHNAQHRERRDITRLQQRNIHAATGVLDRIFCSTMTTVTSTSPRMSENVVG